MKEKEVILELARSLDINQVKAKYKLNDSNLKGLLIKAANLFPENKAESITLPLFSGERDFVIYTDGASRGNPGAAALGILIKDNQDEEVLRVGRNLGTMTNNQAEYSALIQGLKLAQELQADKVLVKSDSELMVKQMTGQYRVRNVNLIPLYQEAKQLSARFKTFLITHIPRGENSIADSLANAALDNKL